MVSDLCKNILAQHSGHKGLSIHMRGKHANYYTIHIPDLS